MSTPCDIVQSLSTAIEKVIRAEAERRAIEFDHAMRQASATLNAATPEALADLRAKMQDGETVRYRPEDEDL